MAGKATSFDIAELAGVSQPTVSRALRGSTTVSEATRTRIQDIARQLNYKVDKNASNLRSRHSNTLALLLFEDPMPGISKINPFFLPMFEAILHAAARHTYDVLTSFQQSSSDWHTDFEDSRKADGLIILGYGDYRDYQERLGRLVEAGTRFVRWGSAEPTGIYGPRETVIGCDNRAGAEAATRHLLAGGRRAIGFIGEIGPGAPEFRARYEGYATALHGAGLPVDPRVQVDAMNNEESGAAAAARLIASGQRFDALVCASDLMAIGAMRALGTAGFSVPGDVAVTGFDDILAASFTNPPLTTVAQPLVEAGELLVSTLLDLIRDGDAQSATIPARLVVRGSA